MWTLPREYAMHSARVFFSALHTILYRPPFFMQCPEASIYCEVNLTNLTAILRKDEYVTSPDDPCSMYKCIVSVCSYMPSLQ